MKMKKTWRSFALFFIFRTERKRSTPHRHKKLRISCIC